MSTEQRFFLRDERGIDKMRNMKMALALCFCLFSLPCFAEPEEGTPAEMLEMVKAGWRFSSCAEGGEAVFPHRLEIQREGETPVAVWRSFKPMAFLGYVDAGEYAVAFFADPLIRPSGNIILAWRLVVGKAPELIFATPYSDDTGVDYDLRDLRVEGGRVLGRITARLTLGHDEMPAIPIELNARTPAIDFQSPLYPNGADD